MPKESHNKLSQWSRAVQIWHILISKAHSRQVITYSMIGDLFGYERHGILGRHLQNITRFCRHKNFPLLPILVVHTKTGSPGDELILADVDLNAERERVFEYKWYEIYPPSEDDFKEAWE